MNGGDVVCAAGDGSGGSGGGGGPATADGVAAEGVAVDRAGNLVIGDTGNQRVRVVAVRTGLFYGQAMKAGDIYTVAGGGTGGLGDGGPATAAELVNPIGAAPDGAANMFVAPAAPQRLRAAA